MSLHRGKVSFVLQHHRATVCVVAACAAAAMLAGCDSSTSTAAGGASTDGGATIKIMVTGTLSSPAASFPQAANGAQAAAQAINSAGGVDGHKIQIITCNDNLSPSGAQSCVREGIADHVVAFAGGLEAFSSSLWPLLDQAKIPWVGPQVLGTSQMANSMSFPFDTGSVGPAVLLGELGVSNGGKNVVVFDLADQPNAVFSANYIAQGVAKAGGKVVKRLSPLSTTTVYSSFATQAEDAHPDAVLCSCTPQESPQLLTALREAGYTGPFGVTTGSLTVAEGKSLGSTAGEVYEPAPMLNPAVSNPGVTQFNTEMNSQPSSVQRDLTAEEPWLAVHVIAELLAGQSSYTSATLLKQLTTTKGVNGLGLIPDGTNWLKAGPVKEFPRATNVQAIGYVWQNGAFHTVGNFVDPFS
jgi:ABC-type branched-subunit amino acid transport system substrate-binding protein